ncbi:MAG: hypothetical protein WCG25_04680 [bacterium]
MLFLENLLFTIILNKGEMPVHVAINTFGLLVVFKTKFQYTPLIFRVSQIFKVFKFLHHLPISFIFIHNFIVSHILSTTEYALVNSQSKSFKQSKIYCPGKIVSGESIFKDSSKTSFVSIEYQTTFDIYQENIALVDS